MNVKLNPHRGPRSVVLIALALIASVSAASGKGPTADSQGLPIFPPLGSPAAPPGNPITTAKAQLGKALFWDEQLSSTRSVACGTCHIPTAGGVDPRTLADPAAATHPGADNLFGTADDVLASPGVPTSNTQGDHVLGALFGMNRQVTPRNTPTMINAAFAKLLFWDGRADGAFLDPISGAVVLPTGATLETVVAEPFISDIEMGHVGRDWQDVVARIDSVEPLALSPSVPAALDGWIAGRSYAELFNEAFGSAEVTAARTCMAVATYMRTLVSDQTPFDEFQAGSTTAMSQLELDGYGAFLNRSCANCHVPPEFTGQGHIQTTFFYTGVRPRDEDLGRFDVTGNPVHRGLMKTPGLRNLTNKGPFFHNGGKATLDDVLDFYGAGGDFEVGTNALTPFNFSPIVGVERTAILAFLEVSLTDSRVEQGLAPFDHPALSEGTARVPVAYGAGTPGSAGQIPQMHAIEPSLLGMTDFTISISGARGGALAGLFVSFVQDVAGSPFGGAALHITQSPGMRVFRVSPLAGSGATDGWASVSFGLPASSAFAGVSFFSQWIVLDPHGGGNFSATEAVEVQLFE